MKKTELMDFMKGQNAKIGDIQIVEQWFVAYYKSKCSKSPNGKHQFVPSPDSFDQPYCKYCYKSN